MGRKEVRKGILELLDCCCIHGLSLILRKVELLWESIVLDLVGSVVVIVWENSCGSNGGIIITLLNISKIIIRINIIGLLVINLRDFGLVEVIIVEVVLIHVKCRIKFRLRVAYIYENFCFNEVSM